MQPQTDDDLNYGKHPLLEKDLVVGSDAYPVVESYAHPYAVSTLATRGFDRRRSTALSAQWHNCTAEAA